MASSHVLSPYDRNTVDKAGCDYASMSATCFAVAGAVNVFPGTISLFSN